MWLTGVQVQRCASVITWHPTAASLPTSPLCSVEMAYKSFWKGSSSSTQIPPKDDTSAAIDALRTRMDGAWTLMDTDTSRPYPPTYPDVGPQPGPTRTSAHSSTNGVTGYQTVFHLYLPRSRDDTHMLPVGFRCSRGGNRVSFSLYSFVHSPQRLRPHIFNRSPRLSWICDDPSVRLIQQRHGCDG